MRDALAKTVHAEPFLDVGRGGRRAADGAFIRTCGGKSNRPRVPSLTAAGPSDRLHGVTGRPALLVLLAVVVVAGCGGGGTAGPARAPQAAGKRPGGVRRPRE